MKKILALAVFFLIIPYTGRSQVFPKEGSTLHYRLIGFSFPAQQSDKCKIEIAKGYFNSDDSFKKNIVAAASGSDKIIAAVPSFGAQYTWRAAFSHNKSTFHHFSTGSVPNVDTGRYRVRITAPAGKYKDAYFFLDADRTLCDMNGLPVWYLPNIEGHVNENSDVRDLKLTTRGTITFLIDDKRAYEINYNGDILWKGPNNEITNRDIHYHHEFTRLESGNYMVLGTESVLLKVKNGDPFGDISIVAKDEAKDSMAMYRTFPIGAVMEYDSQGKLVWSWRTSEHIDGSMIKFCDRQGRNKYDVHLNGFFFDEKNSVIYLSFRNISQLIKIKYPEGTILSSYGGTGNNLFCGQHSCSRSAEGYLYLFNNNVCADASAPSIVMLQEPQLEKDTLKKIWEYPCVLNGANQKQRIDGFTTGGNVTELPGRDIFASISAPYSKIFIISPDKSVLWSAVPERWNPREKKWELLPQYRASIITDLKQIDRLIRNR